MNAVKVSPSSLARPRFNHVSPKRPCPIPMRPLPIDHFRPPRGQKQIFLPNFVITFVRTPNRSPNYASFLVPLWFSKLDLKDYLYNVYKVQTLRIRSYVIQAPVQEGKPHAKFYQPRRWYRPQSQKKMTVELVMDESVDGQGPFVWPEEPKDWSPWMREQFQKAAKEREESRLRRDRGEEIGRVWPQGMDKVRDKAGEILRKAGRGEDPVNVR